MSGIYGVVRFDGKPAQTDFAAMQTTMAHWGADGHTSLSEGAWAFGLALLRSTPEAQFEQLPSLACGGTVALTASARLDNRAELCAAFNLDSSQAAATADGTLLKMAFERWGQDCVHHLLGDWAFAAWDVREQRLFLARDHFGNTGLHYHQWQNGFAFVSGIEGILALGALDKKIDQLNLAKWFLTFPTDGSETIYQDVFRLPPAHVLYFHNHKISTERYWFLENIASLRLRSNQDYVEAFLSTYRQAVHDRTRAYGGIASTLSAGLDSGSVTALAAEVLRQKGETLTAYTSVPRYTMHELVRRGFANEWEMAAEIAKWIGNVNHVSIDATDWTPLQAVQRTVEILQEPGFNASNMDWIHSLMGHAQRSGFRVLLTGQWGNFAASWNGGVYLVWSALKQAEFAAAWGLLRSGAMQRKSLTRALLADIAKPLLLTIQAQWQKFGKTQQLPEWFKHSVISPVLLHQTGLLEEVKNTVFFGHQPYLQTTKQQFFAGLQPYSSPVGVMWQALGAAYGIETRDPTTDKRLLELVASMPISQFHGDGQTRWLMRRAMQGILPPNVQWNARRGIQATDIGHRLLATAQSIETCLQDVMSEKHTMTILNVPKMQNAWKKIQLEAENPEQSDANVLLTGLAVGDLIRDQ
jgi:asparagine synthase (glutamine-hydrolysing)